MKRPRKGARRPPAARHPRKRPPIEAILAERGIVRSTLAGIPKRDRADVEQIVLVAAWRAIRSGRYRPNPKDEPRDALRKWLHGIAWRQAAKYFDSAYVRRFILDPQPLSRLRRVSGPSLDAQVEARDLLRAIERLEPRHQEILLAVDTPETLAAYAAQRGMNPFTAASRLRIARAMLALRIQRWRR
ncbi:RNA polymerase sigma factor [Sorangium sp. So ce1097]|uniref:RNA polymerase sigma factor n=1 Tax=Sorangium sp. So ce1097 TaxID=3133330 RepID=UPI003F622344